MEKALGNNRGANASANGTPNFSQGIRQMGVLGPGLNPANLSNMSHVPQQVPMPNVYGGTYNQPPHNTYPPINPTPPNLRQPPPRRIPQNMPLHSQYPPQFQPPNPSQYPSNTRPRDWESTQTPSHFERNPKRIRTYQNDSSYPPSLLQNNPPLRPQPSYNNPPPPTILQHTPIHPPNPHAIPYPSQLPHPTRPQSSSFQSLASAFRGPTIPAQSDPRPPTFNHAFASQNSAAISTPNLFDQLPPPPRKDLRRSPPDPAAPKRQNGTPAPSQEEPMSFKDFLLTQPDSISSQAAQEGYDVYVKEFNRKKPNKFFDKHIKEEWFRERYDPLYVEKRIERIAEECRKRANEYGQIWDVAASHVCAPPLTPLGDSQKPTKPGNSAKEGDVTNGNGSNDGKGDADNPKHEATDIQMDTVDPKVEHVVTQVAETVQGTVNPEKLPANDETKLSKEEVNVHQEKIQPKSPGINLVLPLRRDHQKDTIFMRGIPLNLNREDLTKILKFGGDGTHKFDLRRLKLGDINPQRSLERFGWAVYDSEVTAAKALEAVRGVKILSEKNPKEDKTKGAEGKEDAKNDDADEQRSRTYVIDCMVNLERKKKFSQGRVLPPIFGMPERMTFDVVQSVKMMRRLDSLRHFDSELNPLTDDFLASLESDGRRLDHIVTYLREVHYFCYYSGNEFLEDPTSMPPQELRPGSERGRHMSDADNRLVKRVDERAKWVLDRDYDRPRSNSDNGEVAGEAAVQAWLDAHTKNEGQGRFRCGLPPHKLFKGPEFVHKHLRSKHGDKIISIREEALLTVYRANFENDASKDEVIKIYYEGLAGANEEQGAGPGTQGGNTAVMVGNAGTGFGQPASSMPMGMYTPYMGMGMQGMQPFPLMMNAPAGFGGGYAGPGGYANPLAFGGRGMNAAPVTGPGTRVNNAPGGMPGTGRGAPLNGAPVNMHRRPPPRRDIGHRDSGPRGRRPSSRRGNDHYRGGHRGHHGGYHGSHHHDGRPSDPRSKGNNRRAYNDLDAPTNATFDLVRYDDV